MFKCPLCGRENIDPDDLSNGHPHHFHYITRDSNTGTPYEYVQCNYTCPRCGGLHKEPLDNGVFHLKYPYCPHCGFQHGDRIKIVHSRAM